MNKYKYIKVIQQNYGQGWEDCSEYETDSKYSVKEYTDKQNIRGRKISLLRSDLAEYRLLGYPTRVIKRKSINKKK